MKKLQRCAIPAKSKLFEILRGIDEQEIAKARSAEGSEVKREFQKGVTRIDDKTLADIIPD